MEHFSCIVLDLERMRSSWADHMERNVLSSEPTRLLSLLRRFSDRKASDDRDKVYALLNLARNQAFLVLDYSLSVSRGFQATTLDIIENTGSPVVFAGNIGRKNRQDLPSWVLDWSATYDDLDRRRADNTEIYKAAGAMHLSVKRGEGGGGGGPVGLRSLRSPESQSP
ncbi:hypothetical protein HYALB_00009506 [Hymenoscyphus albidus]|uniref:Uncharacterized protein n=1 Tax=Hymenoscyphus albidus TaxID=595503 RepID=A0A9N9LL90_9HELO|nr:hypothetical protein HYALB_00009506 [Hymenoscyphus albidus]